MRLLVFTLIFMSLSAQAVVTRNCPESITYSLSHIQLQEVNVRDETDEGNARGVLDASAYLRESPQINNTLSLRNASRGVCYYYGRDHQGNSLQARISGSFNARSRRPVQLVAYLPSGIVTQFPLERVARSGIAMSTEDGSSLIYYRGKYCSYGCMPNYIAIGVAHNSSVH